MILLEDIFSPEKIHAFMTIAANIHHHTPQNIPQNIESFTQNSQNITEIAHDLPAYTFQDRTARSSIIINALMNTAMNSIKPGDECHKYIQRIVAHRFQKRFLPQVSRTVFQTFKRVIKTEFGNNNSAIDNLAANTNSTNSPLEPYSNHTPTPKIHRPIVLMNYTKLIDSDRIHEYTTHGSLSDNLTIIDYAENCNTKPAELFKESDINYIKMEKEIVMGLQSSEIFMSNLHIVKSSFDNAPQSCTQLFTRQPRRTKKLYGKIDDQTIIENFVLNAQRDFELKYNENKLTIQQARFLLKKFYGVTLDKYNNIKNDFDEIQHEDKEESIFERFPQIFQSEITFYPKKEYSVVKGLSEIFVNNLDSATMMNEIITACDKSCMKANALILKNVDFDILSTANPINNPQQIIDIFDPSINEIFNKIQIPITKRLPHDIYEKIETFYFDEIFSNEIPMITQDTPSNQIPEPPDTYDVDEKHESESISQNSISEDTPSRHVEDY